MRETSQTTHRPASVTFMALGVLMIAVINLMRAGEALTGWRLWTGLLPIPPVYLLGSGVFWAAVCLPLAWGLWQGHAWAGRFTPLAAWAYSLYYWLDLAFLKQGAEKNNLIFLIAANIILLTAMHWVLWKSRARF
jgi:hypothetical protein